jgi:DNA-binding GntR family transcriptional regulator
MQLLYSQYYQNNRNAFQEGALNIKSEMALRPKRQNNQKRLADKAAEELRRMIIANSFEKGEPLSEVRLAEMLEMSRTPIREAIGKLCREGLLKMIPGRGAIVAEMTLKDVKEINDLRMVLEPLALETAIRKIPDEALDEQLCKWLDLKSQLQKQSMVPSLSLSELDTQLHDLILAYCDNDRLRDFLNVLRYQIMRYVLASWDTREFVIETIDQHIEILERMKERNPEGAQKALREHIEFNKRFHLDFM